MAVAADVAREAGRRARAAFCDRSSLTVEKKGHQDFVSEADRAVERFVRESLAGAFPTDTIWGEEGGGGLSPATWIVDPIDGTTNFLRGFPYYSVSIGFVAGGHTEIGLIYDPTADELFSARRGGGAWLGTRRLRVRDQPGLVDALVALGRSERAPEPSIEQLVRDLLEAGAEFRRLGSAALALAHVADGRLDGFFEAHLNSWDAVAGLLLVQEAGGRIRDFPGAGGLEEGGLVLAASPGVFGPLEALLGPA